MFKDSLEETAAQLLVTTTALAELTLVDARVAIRCMSPKWIPQGTVFISQGEVTQTDFMMLIVAGEVMVQNEAVSRNDSAVMSVMGPGSLIGEMGFLDGEPRSASCTASTDLTVAILSRGALRGLMSSEPAVAARLMLAISKRLADRLREANRKINILDSLSRALQQELDVAHQTSVVPPSSTSRAALDQPSSGAN